MWFKIEEFLIDPKMRTEQKIVPLHVQNKIWRVHVPILNDIRKQMGESVFISKNSGYRPIQWELERDRSGKSEHTFSGLGAVDLTAYNFELLCDLCIDSNYMRVCIYEEEKFVHCDMKGMKRLLFKDEGGKWQFQRNR